METWEKQKEMMEFFLHGAVKVVVEWKGEDDYVARLFNYGSIVRTDDGYNHRKIPRGTGATGPIAVTALFNQLLNKTVEITPGATPGTKKFIFTAKGYVPENKG